MSKLHDKQRYLEQIEKGKSHRQIAKNMEFSVSATVIRDELLQAGMMVLKNTVLDPKTNRNHMYYESTGIDFCEEVYADKWEDGTPKSRNNAFDLSTARGLFSKAEIANAINKGRPNNYNTPVRVIAYSRA